MLRWLGVTRDAPEPPAAPRPATEEKRGGSGGETIDHGDEARLRAKYMRKDVRYKKWTDAEPRTYSVTFVFPRSGSRGPTRWHEFVPELFADAQKRVPPGATHPACAAVLAAAMPVPAGHEVHPARNGVATGTTMAGLLGRSKWLDRDAARAGFVSTEDLLVARAQGREPQVVSNADMERGKREEAEALALLSAAFGIEIGRIGFLMHPSGVAGASPDGICVRIPCLVEIKSKRAKTELDMPDEHYDQVQTQLLSTARGAADSTDALIRFALYVQYVSSTDKGFPLMSIRVVKYDKPEAPAMLAAAHRYVARLRAAPAIRQPALPPYTPATAEARARAAAAAVAPRAPVRTARRGRGGRGAPYRGGAGKSRLRVTGRRMRKI
jgi:hypothetical protein